jgi:hypothetical protein
MHRKIELWDKIVQAKKLDLDQMVSYVKARDVKRITGEEPRIMAFMNTEDDLPTIFRRHGVFVVPISRQEYAIIHGKGFEEVRQIAGSATIHATTFAFPVSVSQSQGESRYLDYAYSTGLISKFTKRKQLIMGHRGRRTTSFAFRVDGSPQLSVKGAQIEVDGSFEDEQQLIIAEAKIRVPNSFNIRQLYYPFKTFEHNDRDKTVRCLFLAYEPVFAEYHLFEYEFADPADYETINLVNAEKFKISATPDPLSTFAGQADPSKGAVQADDVSKIMKLPFIIRDGVNNARKVARYFAFDKRQSSYYRDAAQKLGLVELRGSTYVLTSTGEKYVNLPEEVRTKFFLKLLLEWPIPNTIIHKLASGYAVSRTEIESMVNEYDRRISRSTVPRRAQSIIAWFRWIQDNTSYCEVDADGTITPFNYRRLNS